MPEHGIIEEPVEVEQIDEPGNHDSEDRPIADPHQEQCGDGQGHEQAELEPGDIRDRNGGHSKAEDKSRHQLASHLFRNDKLHGKYRDKKPEAQEYGGDYGLRAEEMETQGRKKQQEKGSTIEDLGGVGTGVPPMP